MKREAAILPKPLLAAARPIRIQRSRKEKQVSPNGLPIVYVGRPTKFGNPFVINVLATRQDCVDNFELCTCADNEYKRKVKQELKGKNLSCWCKVGEPCHADILLKIANS